MIMDSNMIIQQGERAKFLIASQRADFSLSDVEFYVELSYGMMGGKTTIQKSQMQMTTNSQWVMMFDTSEMVGKVTAKFYVEVPDTDASRGIRQEVDCQVIAFVVSTPCPRFFTCPDCTQTHDVTYTRTEQSSIADQYVRLLDMYGRILKTSEGETMYALRGAIESNN